MTKLSRFFGFCISCQVVFKGFIIYACVYFQAYVYVYFRVNACVCFRAYVYVYFWVNACVFFWAYVFFSIDLLLNYVTMFVSWPRPLLSKWNSIAFGSLR